MVAALRAIAVFNLILVNTALWGTLVFAMGLVKLLWPLGRWRRRCVLIMAGMGALWVDGNRLIWKAFLPTVLDIRGMPVLRMHGRYLLLANHLSWTDIIVLFIAFNRRSAFIRFFLKHILLWMPFIGQGCWALEFPFMKRYSKEYLERHPERRNEDFETTRRSCRNYRHIPVTIANFVEGTRFTRAKQKAQDSPFRNLLKPRFGGIAFVLASMGEHLDGMFDVTLAYPGLHHDVTFIDFITGRIPRIVVVVRELPLEPRFNAREVISPGPLRQDLKGWITKVWEEKDELIEELRDNA